MRCLLLNDTDMSGEFHTHHPSAVIPAKAGTHPGRWQLQTSDTTCVGEHFPTDAWMGPRLRGGDELRAGGFAAALMIFSGVM